MIHILIAGNKKSKLAGLVEGLETYPEITTYQQTTLEGALDTISTTKMDLVVADEEVSGISGIAFAEKLVSVNPMINCAVVSPLSAKEFHEASEGLGVLMQLPVGADASQASLVVERIKKVLNLTDKSK